jgi:hypothetical protein
MSLFWNGLLIQSESTEKFLFSWFKWDPLSMLNIWSVSYRNIYTDGENKKGRILIYIQQNATLGSLFYLKTALHISGGTNTRNM